jgi:hypothetical protein
MRAAQLSSCTLLSNFDERLCGDAKPLMKAPDHLECERAPTVEHLVYTIAGADEGNEVTRFKPIFDQY